MSEQKVVQRKRPDLVTVIAIWQFAMAGLLLLGLIALGVGLLAVLMTAYGSDLVVGSVVLAIAIVIVLALVIVNVATGWGLLALKNWARWLTIILGVFSLSNFPLGTVIGGLKIWYLMTPEAKAAFGVE